MSVQPRRSRRSSIPTVTPNAGRITTSSGPSAFDAGVVVAHELDAHGPQLLVDVRVVDDFAGEEHAAVGKALARLVGVVDGAVDAVAEAELAGEVDGQAARPEREVVGLDLLDEAL